MYNVHAQEWPSLASSVKGAVLRDFRPKFFFYQIGPLEPLDGTPDGFRCFRRFDEIFKLKHLKKILWKVFGYVYETKQGAQPCLVS